MNGSESVLTVFLGKKAIADLLLTEEQLTWQHTDDWRQKGFPVSPHLPLSNDIPSININRFLRNMLPEGQAFDELIQSVHVSRQNTFALIRALGLDTPGALVLRPREIGLPEQGYFRVLIDDELADRLDNRKTAGLIIWNGKPRLSVAGVQDKINLVKNSKGQMGFGDGTLCSTHILKFERQSQSHLILNEYVTMQLAQSCGIKVANVQLQQYRSHMALLVERFDRKLINDDEVKRRHIIDGCQALNLPPEYKYERNFGGGRDVAHIRDGVSIPKLFEFADLCQNPALTKQQILDWLLFNILVYNSDAHGKNISFFVGPEGMSLTPFYDLVNIKFYSEFEQDFAMALGDEFDIHNVNAYQIADFSESCQLSRTYVAKRLQNIIKKMMTSLPQVFAKINDEFREASYFAKYEEMIILRCKHLIKESQDIQTIQL